MIIPIRCFTCGKVIANKWTTYYDRITSGESAEAVLDSLELKRYCCRRMLLTHVDLMDVLMLKSEKELKELHNSSNRSSSCPT